MILTGPLPAWQRSRQPEPWEHTVFEAGQRGDPGTGEGQNVEPDSLAAAALGAQVCAERRLTVGSSRHQLEPAARAEQAGAEMGHDASALVFKRHRRHRHEDVVGQEIYERVQVGGLPGPDEPLHDLVLGG